METPEKIALNVVIAGRKYKYNVDPEFEDLMRSAANDVTDRLVALKSKYTFADNQDALATLLLQYVTHMARYKKEDISGTILREIKYLDDQLDDYMKHNIVEEI